MVIDFIRRILKGISRFLSQRHPDVVVARQDEPDYYQRIARKLQKLDMWLDGF